MPLQIICNQHYLSVTAITLQPYHLFQSFEKKKKTLLLNFTCSTQLIYKDFFHLIKHKLNLHSQGTNDMLGEDDRSIWLVSATIKKNRFKFKPARLEMLFCKNKRWIFLEVERCLDHSGVMWYSSSTVWQIAAVGILLYSFTFRSGLQDGELCHANVLNADFRGFA